MRVLEATIEVHSGGEVEVHIAGALDPGEHRGIFILEDEHLATNGRAHVLSLPPLRLGFPSELKFNRDEIYS